MTSPYQRSSAPLGHAVQIVQYEPAHALTSTDRIQAAIDNVTGVAARERELSNKQRYADEPLTVEERDELNQLRQAREVKRLQSAH